MSKQYFGFLLEKYTQGTLSPEEWQELKGLLYSDDYESDLASFIDEKLNESSSYKLPREDIAGILFQRITDAKKNVLNGPATDKTSKKRMLPVIGRPWLAAAAMLGVIVTGGAFYYGSSSSNSHKNTAVKNEVSKNNAPPPSGTKAVITLTDGHQIVLDSAGDGLLAMQGSATISKLADGQIVYLSAEKNDISDKLPEYNTIYVPRGSRVLSLTLSDGTKVWLNAASSMRYPTIFNADERKVEVSGEVYFEVAKNKTKKFVVTTHTVSTEVFGTHFNIRAHDDESFSRVTLLEGSVRVSGGNNARMLHPGEQAAFSASGNLQVEKADTEQVIAWKEARFQFEGFDIKEVMQEISRWYDLETVYEGAPVSQHFRGGISRNVDALLVFKMLEATDAVHFRIENKKIIVTP